MSDRARHSIVRQTVTLRALGAAALTQGFRYLAREPMRPYQNKGIHAWIAHWIYAETSPSGIFSMQLDCGALALVLQLPFSIVKTSKASRNCVMDAG